jgi:hypothetical protein
MLRGESSLPGRLCPGDNCPRPERLDLVDRRKPFAPTLGAGLGQIQVHVVVNGVSRDHQTDRRDEQASGVIGVGVAEIDDDEFVSLELEAVAVEGLRILDVLRKLPGESPLPERKPLRRRAMASCGSPPRSDCFVSTACNSRSGRLLTDAH